MLLATDIGNTNIVIGGIDNDEIIFQARIVTNHVKTSDQYKEDLKNILLLFDINPKDVHGCIISSVVPPVFEAVKNAIIGIINKEPIIVEPELNMRLIIQSDNPSRVGSDRIVIAVAALEEYKAPFVLFDFGTATNIEVVNSNNTYLGGCIIPGVRISLDALSSCAAQLPNISFDKPKNVIGRNTVDCMKSGIMHGTASMVDGMIERIEEELGEKTTVIATGGMAQFIVPLCHRKIKLDDKLMLKGLNILYRDNIKR